MTRSSAARMAAHESWARTADRSARTSAARAAILAIDRWELAQLIVDGKLPHRITARVLEQYIAAQLPDRPAVAS